MPTAKTMSIILLIALVGSNAYWVYHSIDTGISYSYLHDEAVESKRMLQVAVAVIPVVADPESDRADVVSAAESASGSESFEKDGLVWISGLGLGFDESERVKIASSGPVDSFWPQR